ncbi:MAG: type IV pilus assembly protein PilM [Pseudomonadota bacterium]
MGPGVTVGSPCVGLDIGSSAIKAIVLKQGRKETRLLSFGIEPLPPQTIVDGAIMDQAAVVEAIGRLRDALGFRIKACATAIAGHQVIVKKIQLPFMSREELEQQIPLEAEQHIPFKRDEVDLDYQIVVEKNAQGQMEIILVAAKKEMIADTTQVIRDAKLQPLVIDVAAFSVQNAFEAAYGEAAAASPVALIHVGNSITHVNIIAGGNSVFARDVTVGGAAFTEEIQRRLHVSHDEAEAFKLAACDPVAGGAAQIPAGVAAVIDEVAETTAAKLQRPLEFFLASAPDVVLTKIYLSGGSANVGALLKLLELRAKVPVEIMDPFRRTLVDATKLDAGFVKAHAAEAAVAFGLALRTAGDGPS